MDCVLCKLQYVAKWETTFNVHLNNHSSNVFDTNAISTCHCFSQDKHRFNKHAKLSLIGSITNTNKPKETLQELLKKWENFCIRALKILQPHGLNHELIPARMYPAIALFKFKFVTCLDA